MGRRRLPEIAAPLSCLALFYLSLFTFPPVPRDAPWLMSVEESRVALEESRRLMREGALSEALTITRRLHRAFPDSHTHLFQIATLESQVGTPLATAEAWQEYLDLSPTPLEACPAIGHAWQAAGRSDRALAALEFCLSIDPENPDSLLYLALARERAGQLEGAETLYRTGIQVSPSYPDHVIGLARVRLRRGALDEARRAFEETIRRWPENSDALLLGGMLERAAGRLTEARALLLRGIEISPGDVDLYLVLGGVAERQGDLREAARCFAEVLRLSPDRADVLARRNRLLARAAE